MSSSLRQSELFAGNDWQAIYRAFTQVNFNASDPPSINRALRDYIQTAYPEDFNDWIESSEFVAIIDLLSWLAGTLAFKTDINARENFLETAESRESILRLARFLSYQPRRTEPARGLLKIVEIETDDDVTDAYGASLNNAPIRWNNADDPDWFERFTLILNNALVQSNPFGTPLKNAAIADVRTQVYRVNGRMADLDLSFSSSVAGTQMQFELVNGDVSDDIGFVERDPNPDGAFHLFYRNDSSGNGSPDTGFFAMFKQGVTRRETFQIANPTENLLIDLAGSNVTENDVWVQSVSNDVVAATWTKVPAVFSENVTFNSVPLADRNIYSVITRDLDRVSLRFADGRFGNAPVGTLRATYRVSNGLQYSIRPQEISRVRLPIRFYNRRGILRTLYLTFALQSVVSNASARETDEQVRRRAPGVYAAQNRMVSGDDYNRFPLQGGIASKIKAVNRVYSGHSRHIDLHDPTGNYQHTSVFADDGILFREAANSYVEVPDANNKTPFDIRAGYLQALLSSPTTEHYAKDAIFDLLKTQSLSIVWNQTTEYSFSSTGWVTSDHLHFRPGSYLLMNVLGERKWVVISSMSGPAIAQPVSGAPGPVQLSEPIPSGAIIERIVPGYGPVMTTETTIKVDELIDNHESFSLWYDISLASSDPSANPHWVIKPTVPLLSAPHTAGSAIKIATVDYVGGGLWRLSARGSRYVFESEKKVRWFLSGERTVDKATGRQVDDLIRVLSINPDLNDTSGYSLKRDFNLAIQKLYQYADGQKDPRKIAFKTADLDEDGFEDRPDTFLQIISSKPHEHHLFWERTFETGALGALVPFTDMIVFESEANRLATGASTGTVAFQKFGATAATDETFWIKQDAGWVQDLTNYKVAIGRGTNVAAVWNPDEGPILYPVGNAISFHWKHFAPATHRIDPARTNIVDMFVLSSEYDFQTRQWIKNGAIASEIPAAPSELELKAAFASYERYKMFSDTIVWRPVRYKMLFGNGADPELRAGFKVVKLPNSPYSDGEIRTRVIRSINEFFDVSRWDFGETFYFTELAAYIHQQLANVIASVVIVPTSLDGRFGEGFEVRCQSDEIFVSTAQVSDVTIIGANTTSNLRIR